MSSPELKGGRIEVDRRGVLKDKSLAKRQIANKQESNEGD